jgi:hypothetical protein
MRTPGCGIQLLQKICNPFEFLSYHYNIINSHENWEIKQKASIWTTRIRLILSGSFSNLIFGSALTQKKIFCHSSRQELLTSSVMIPVGAIYPPIKIHWHSQENTKKEKEKENQIIRNWHDITIQTQSITKTKPRLWWNQTNLEQAMIKLLLDLHEGQTDPSASGSHVQILRSDRIQLLAHAFDWWPFLGRDYKVKLWGWKSGLWVSFVTGNNGFMLSSRKVDRRDRFPGKKRELRWSESQGEGEVHGNGHSRKTVNFKLCKLTVPFSKLQSRTVPFSNVAQAEASTWITWEKLGKKEIFTRMSRLVRVNKFTIFGFYFFKVDH